MQLVKKRCFSRYLVIAALLLLAGAFSLLVPTVAAAATSNSLEITGDGVTISTTYTMDQLKEMKQTQNVYSAINTWPTKKWYVGKGVSLKHLLELAGIKEDARLLKFTSNDGYSVTLTVKELLEDKRYYYPHFKDNSVGGDGDGNIPGSTTDKQPIEPIVALISVEGSNNPAYMNDLNTILLMMGQRSVTEQNGNLFVKYLSKIEVLTTEPSKWDNPQANPDSGEVSVGTMVALSNVHMDDDKVYYTTDGTTPTVDSTMYNWIAKRWWSARADVVGVYNCPIGPITQNTTIKAITIGPGKTESDVVTFSYTVPGAAPVEKPVEPVEKPVEPGKVVNLSDIKNHWAQQNIEKLVTAGAVGGYPDGTFKPDYTITRAEFATILVKAFKLESQSAKVFTDTASHWAKDYIAAANANQIVNGYSDGRFGPDDPITREQMALMIYKAAKLTPVAESPQFVDSSAISEWARGAVAAAYQKGIMKGYPGNVFQPQGKATKAEAVTVIVGCGQ